MNFVGHLVGLIRELQVVNLRLVTTLPIYNTLDVGGWRNSLQLPAEIHRNRKIRVEEKELFSVES